MYSVSLMVEDINKGLEGEVVSNVMVITDLQAITPEIGRASCRERV